MYIFMIYIHSFMWFRLAASCPWAKGRDCVQLMAGQRGSVSRVTLRYRHLALGGHLEKPSEAPRFVNLF